MAGWLNRKQLDVINYLHAENEILKEQLEKKDVKLALSNTQRGKLAKCGKKLGRKGLVQYASIVTPDRILYWHRKLGGGSRIRIFLPWTSPVAYPRKRS